MIVYYSYILFLLLIIHWSNSASLHSPSKIKLLDQQNSSIMNKKYLKTKPIYPSLYLIKRLKRWNKNKDNDEIEIPLDEINVSVNNSNENSLLNIKTIETNSSIIENFDELINSTIVSDLNLTTFEVYTNENITITYPLLQQDLIELNQTTSTILEDILQDNKTDIINSTILLTTEFMNTNSTDFQPFTINITELKQIISNDKNESIITQLDNLFNEFQSSSSSSSSVPFNSNQTIDQIKFVPTTIILDYPTISLNTTEDNQTDEWNILVNDSYTGTINNTNISLKDAILIDYELHLNDTEIIPQESNETIILLSKSVTIPICDHSCQCLKECPYGFEILNDTCLCNPPCKNYQCFGNDTCIVTNKGEPLCQPENGTEYPRPTRCYQPRDAGYHDINIRYYNRWYYNPDQDTCHLFIYRGLGGNENNFQTLHECHLECITCGSPFDRGECLGHIDMWYYDNKKRDCTQFEYSGCKGNENKFLKKDQCIDTCINRIPNIK